MQLSDEVIQVAFLIDEDHFERLWCAPAGTNLAQVRSIPFFVYDLAIDDLISYRFDDAPGVERFMMDSLVRPSPRSTFRLALDPGSSLALRQEFADFAVAISTEWSLNYERYSDLLFAFDCESADVIASLSVSELDGITLDVGTER